MNDLPGGTTTPTRHDWLTLVARIVVGGQFLWFGLAKIADPVGFLKLVREYDWLQGAVALNAVAALLPWVEVVCGLLLLAGVALRGTALVSVGLLVPFTLAVFHRAWVIHGAGGTPFCGIRFDCGCGAGEVLICRKLLENTLLIGASAFLLLVPSPRWCLRFGLGGITPPVSGPVR